MPDGTVTTPDRSTLRAVQTPQTFDAQKLIAAHERARAEALAVTDDAMLFEHYYGDLRLVTVEGAERNKKLTTKEDFDALNRPSAPAMRVGQGYDAHRLAEGRRLILCGVEVPHDRGLDGHSDADVAVHALMDALLGALALGDIGRHFPDSDPAYKGISSMKLLEHVMGLLRQRGWRVGNADVTIVAQKPKLAAYIPQMRENLADALGIPAEGVNVKATTTERMGFEGRRSASPPRRFACFEQYARAGIQRICFIPNYLLHFPSRACYNSQRWSKEGDDMAQLSDNIEQFIKELMSEDAHIELRRNELAQHFGCAPSQINYVLATRFSVDHGYIIESRRGGGGYVRIVRMQTRGEPNFLEALLNRVGNSVDEETANAIISNLMERKMVTDKEAALMRSAVSRNALALPISAKDVLRAAVFRNMLMQVFKNIEEGKRDDV